ncbi:HNH endonuclease [Actinobacillus minor]|uniref:HNH endonuclease n=1 Tax=Actinobacillus minor TaxID=51047 RepID=UPI0023F4B91C|nr:HNH endonuclease [Actinobacillus minor]MDD6910455.1 HNH endonuclease [Actinobacillus minor]MDY4713845.1 HNH endonuclease [Actinobacillus minor]
MEIKVDFSALFSSIRKMGITELVPFSIDFNSQPVEIVVEGLSSSKGIEVPIADVTPDPDSGVFTYQGEHVVLFIPDHSFKYDEAIADPKNNGNKYHLTDCRTLEQMRKSGRFERYHATNNRTGIFHISGSLITQEAEVELSVCKNCLAALNYQNYTLNRIRVFNEFNLEDFFNHYETFFRKIPNDKKLSKPGYVDDWEEISKRYRESVKFTCEECHVNLEQYRYLLDVHHKNGVKQDNKEENLKAMCKLCHAQEAFHSHMIVKQEDEFLIKKLRWEQGIF